MESYIPDDVLVEQAEHLKKEYDIKKKIEEIEKKLDYINKLLDIGWYEDKKKVWVSSGCEHGEVEGSHHGGFFTIHESDIRGEDK
jgi:hypothetical protein